MKQAWLALGLVATALTGCGQKETGPEETPADSAPETATPVESAVDDPAAAKPMASFAGMDADNDGRVTSAEHANASQTMFRMMDADSDGSVTVAEMDAARDAIGGSTTLSSEKKIEAVDGDGDGKLTLAEHVSGANGMFAKMDTNTDDALDRTEWDAGHAMLKPAADSAPAKG